MKERKGKEKRERRKEENKPHFEIRLDRLPLPLRDLLLLKVMIKVLKEFGLLGPLLQRASQ